MTNGFDWPALMRGGIVALRLRPAEFWTLTPAELALMLGQGRPSPSLTKTGLDALLAAYPDKTEGESDERL